jgi:hypothetical protein
LLGFVLLKAVLFSLLQEGLSKFRAALFMVMGNVLTSCIGVAIAMVFSVPILLPIALVGIYPLTLLPAYRLVKISNNRLVQRAGMGGVSSILIGLLVLSVVLFFAGQGAVDEEQLTLYWFLKVIYISSALAVSLVLTTFWEEWVISLLAARKGIENIFAVPVFRANTVVLVIAAIIAAILMLPQRLHSPDGLVHLISNIAYYII